MQTQVIHSLITQKSFQCLSSDTRKIEEGVLLHLLWVNLTCFICSAIYTKKKKRLPLRDNFLVIVRGDCVISLSYANSFEQQAALFPKMGA